MGIQRLFQLRMTRDLAIVTLIDSIIHAVILAIVAQVKIGASVGADTELRGHWVSLNRRMVPWKRTVFLRM